MADFRSVQTRMWREDEWFDSLDTEARLFWIYLFTNPSSSPAGIFRLTMRTMSNESGIPFDRALELMERFAADKKAYYSGGVVWVVNMRRLQFPDLDGSGAWQVATKMQSDIDAIPDTNPLKGEYLRRNGYPIIVAEMAGNKEVKRVLIQYGYPINTQSVNETVTVTETETVTVTKTQPKQADPDFAAAVSAWEGMGLLVNPTIKIEIEEAVDYWRGKGHPEFVADAIRIAARANVRRWDYVQGILRRCEANGTAPGAENKTNGKTSTKAPAKTAAAAKTYDELKAAYLPAGWEDVIEH